MPSVTVPKAIPSARGPWSAWASATSSAATAAIPGRTGQQG